MNHAAMTTLTKEQRLEAYRYALGRYEDEPMIPYGVCTFLLTWNHKYASGDLFGTDVFEQFPEFAEYGIGCGYFFGTPPTGNERRREVLREIIKKMEE